MTVSAQGAPVQTASAERGGTITSSQLQNLIVRGRNVSELLGLTPGVVPRTYAGLDWSTGNNAQGGRSFFNNTMGNGFSVNDNGALGFSVMLASMDSSSEVRILLTNYQAEYGRLSPGAPTVAKATCA